MTPFIHSPEVIFRGTYILLALVGLLSTVCIAMSISYHLKPRYALTGLAAMALSSAFFCVLSVGIIIRDRGGTKEDLAHAACSMPAWVVVLLTVALALVVGGLFCLIVRRRMHTLTAVSVKEALAVLPVGLCFYDETGRTLLMNGQIDEECRETTGYPLYDGTAFWSDMCRGKTRDGVTCHAEGESVIAERADGRVTCYRRICHDFDGRPVWELTGADISREYALKKTLEEKNASLRRMNDRLRGYGETVTEVTKERETLAARVKVHDSMGSLILTTKKALSQGDAAADELIATWSDLVSFLAVPTGEPADKFAEAETTAESVGVRLVLQGERLPKGSPAEEILATALTECITNTARHADGDELTMEVSYLDGNLRARFVNNGAPPKEEVREGGGLSFLRTMVENAGGEMRIESAPRFCLTVTLPKEENKHE